MKTKVIFSTSFKSFLASNFIMGALLAVSLQFMWGLINALQLIVLTVLFNTKVPVNAKEVLVVILTIANFELVDTEEIYPTIFKFTETESFNQIYDACEMETSNFIMLIGILLVPMSLYFIGAVPYIIYKKSKHA